VKLVAGKALGRPELDQWIITAAELTGDPDFVRSARSARQRLGKDAPFAGFTAGQVTAGLLASEVLHRARPGEPLLKAGATDLIELCEQAEAFRQGLSTRAQAAFDGAVLAIACQLDQDQGTSQNALAKDLFGRVARRWADHPEHLERLGHVLGLADGWEALVDGAAAVASLPNPERSLGVLAKTAAQNPKVLAQLIRRVAPRVSRSVLAEFQALSKAAARRGELRLVPPGAPEGPLPDTYSMVTELDRWLEPSFSIRQLLRGGEPDQELCDDDEEDEELEGLFADEDDEDDAFDSQAFQAAARALEPILLELAREKSRSGGQTTSQLRELAAALARGLSEYGFSLSPEQVSDLLEECGLGQASSPNWRAPRPRVRQPARRHAESTPKERMR
jgi:hypothetical protein